MLIAAIIEQYYPKNGLYSILKAADDSSLGISRKSL
jgi:hypothetical protein